jgi:hypothetical protein
MNKTVSLLGLAALVAFGPANRSELITPRVRAQTTAAPVQPEPVRPQLDGADDASPAEQLVHSHTRARLQNDFAAMQVFRPAHPFWQHIFTIADGSILFGSAADGRLLATFPARGDWTRQVVWADVSLATTLGGQRLSAGLAERRKQVVRLLESSVGSVLHNETRGLFLLPNARRYGSFLGEWGTIYERFGVPAEIGLAQAIVESGLNGTVRSEARAVGFCQWLAANWNKLNRLAPSVIEGHNQTTQAPYCAAYLTILATMYGSFIPALSEHHTGGTNVGRTVINGERLGGTAVREQYLLGADFVRDLRNISRRRYREMFRTYGPRSFLYAEMVFGNTFNVTSLTAATPQSLIFAMRAPRSIPLAEITRRTGLSVNEVRRFNPALVRQVPAGANLYLPSYVPEFGPDVSFWHHPPSTAYSSVLTEFVGLDVRPERWSDPSFEPVLRDFRRRFEETNTEEGTVMATTLAYVIDDMRTSRRGAILDEFRTSGRILRLFEQGVRERAAFRDAQARRRS